MNASTTKNISLYIPRIFGNITEEMIKSTFEKSRIGKVNHVDIVSKLDSKFNPYFCAYVHFDYWFDNVASKNFYENVLNPEKEAKIFYNDPWYWKVYENKSTKQIVNGRKICLDLKTSAEEPISDPDEEMEQILDEMDDCELEEMLSEMEIYEQVMERYPQDLEHAMKYIEYLENNIDYLHNAIDYYMYCPPQFVC